MATTAPEQIFKAYDVRGLYGDEIDGVPAVDVLLAGLGVAVTWVPGCTYEDARFYSYRRSGTTGRFGGVVLRREVA